MNDPRFVSTLEAGRLLGVAQSCVWNWMASGRIPSEPGRFLVGGRPRRRLLRATVDALVAGALPVPPRTRRRGPARATAESPLTTGQAARFCRLCPRTIIEYFDSGLLEGYRVPGSKVRRIPRDSFRRFLIANGIPTGHFDLWDGLTRAIRAGLATG